MDQLFYYSKSKNVLPGLGIHEFINDISQYKPLCKINNFRQILSNFHKLPFIYNKLTYNSIEHAFQSEKIRLVDPDVAFKFSIESKDDISKGNGLNARQNRKIIHLDKKTIEHWNKVKMKIMNAITESKIKQCKIFRDTLLATNNAQLWHIVIRQKPVRIIYLEKLRDKYKK